MIAFLPLHPVTGFTVSAERSHGTINAITSGRGKSVYLSNCNYRAVLENLDTRLLHPSAREIVVTVHGFISFQLLTRHKTCLVNKVVLHVGEVDTRQHAVQHRVEVQRLRVGLRRRTDALSPGSAIAQVYLTHVRVRLSPLQSTDAP